MNDKLSAREKDALWARIEPAIPAGAAAGMRTYPTRYFTAAAALFLAVGVSAYTRWAAPRAAPVTGPLAYAQGGYPSLELFANGGQAEFEDHSRVHAEPGARVELLDNAALRFALKQPRGVAKYAVTPGGTRHWTVDTPLATIEVVGTEFDVSATDARVEVRVAHGVVIVRGDHVPGHAVRLTDGQSLEIKDDASASVVAPTVDSPGSKQEPPTLKPHGSETRESARVAELMSFADSLRAEGRNDAAAAALKQVVLKHGSDPHAALAAFTLGRLQMDMLHNPDEAKWALERALELNLAPSLRNDAKRRLEDLTLERTRGDGRTAP